MEEIIVYLFLLSFGFGLGVITYSLSIRSSEKELDERYRQWWYDNKRLIDEYNRKHNRDGIKPENNK